MSEFANNLVTAAMFVIAGLIVAYAVREARRLAARVAALIEDCNALRERIEGFANPLVFRDHYKQLLVGQRARPPLDAAWREYDAMLVDLGPGAPIGAAKPASEIFNLDLGYRAGLDLRQFDDIPNRLVGIGLFLTFLGLAVSIGLANTSGGSEATLEALRLLLRAAAFKFVTSLAAIGASLWFARERHQILDRLDTAVAALCAALDAKTTPASEAQAAAAARAELERQTGIMAHGDAALAHSIAAALDHTIKASLAEALLPVSEAIRGMGAQLGGQNVQALRDMVETFAKELSGAARDQARELVGVLDSARVAMKDAPAQIASAGTRFAAVIEAEALNFEGRVAGVTTALGDALGATNVAQAGVAGRLEAFGAALATGSDELSARLAAFNATIARTAGDVAATAAQLDKAVAATAPLAGVAAQMEAAAAALSEGARAAGAIGGEGAAAAAALDRSAREFSASLETLDTTIGRVLDRLAMGIESVDRSVAAMVSRKRRQLIMTPAPPAEPATEMTVAKSELGVPVATPLAPQP